MNIFFSVLDFVRIFSEVLYVDPQRHKKWAFFNGVQNRVKNSFHNISTLTLYLCQPSGLGDESMKTSYIPWLWI